MKNVSQAEKCFIEDGIAQDFRNDGRKRDEFRPLHVQTGVISQASGSARAQLGGTDVVATVKAELGTPSFSRPNEGRLEVAVECSPTAAPEFKGRGGDDLSLELTRLLERSLVGTPTGAGSAIALSPLCIQPGKTCWVLYLDVLILAMDGSLADCAGIACKAALSDTTIPKVEVTSGEGEGEEGEEGGEPVLEIIDDREENSRLDASGVQLLVTVTKSASHTFVDPNGEEEGLSLSALSIGVRPNGSICGLTKTAGGGISPAAVFSMIGKGVLVSKQMHREVEEKVAAAAAREDVEMADGG